MKNVPKGVMLGHFINDSGREIEVAVHGTPQELARVAAVLGLEPDPDQAKAIFAGENNGQPIGLFDKNGSAVILRPVMQAADLIGLGKGNPSSEDWTF